ncbi:hypothetical protein F5882DRAFT_22088 [Hyaloscypha sp. PMI_1271]|nr:hypothetical protein F5882DRAFT_22088 [Hyaloscypha sp. PMI_1271]
MPPALAESFKRSYGDFESYPRNLICQTTYRDAADAYYARLRGAERTLLVQDEDEIEVPFRDLLPSAQGFVKQNIFDDEALKAWLGDISIPGPVAGSTVGELATKKDPLCRFIYLYAENSREPLKLSLRMLLRILSYHQVMPIYIDFLSVFGSQAEPRDLRFSGFREQNLIKEPARGPQVEFLGRSGRQFQLCYNLKASNYISLPETKLREQEWSIRQAAIHHQFDVETGASLWIVTKGDKEIKNRIEDMNGVDGRPEDRDFSSPENCFRRTLDAHLVCCHWSVEDWRWYVRWLEESIDRATAVVFAPRNRSVPRHHFEPKDVQYVQSHEEKINVAIMILEANVNVLKSLKEFYKNLLNDKSFPWRDTCKDDIMAFSEQVKVMAYDLEMQISRAKLLVKIIGDRKALVLQHLQAQGTEKMEDLTTSMHELGIMAQKEAIAMRIITVVTVIFLPATFVSTFFSTDIVKYQNGGGFSMAALENWFEVTIPLTFVTLVLCYIFFKKSSRSKLQRLRRVLKAPASKSATS